MEFFSCSTAWEQKIKSIANVKKKDVPNLQTVHNLIFTNTKEWKQ